VQSICNTSVLAAFEDVQTGLAAALRYSFAAESGGLSPRLCIVRDLTLCSTVKAQYTVSSAVNTVEINAQGGWTGRFTPPLESLEAARFISQRVVNARARGLAVAYSATDRSELQTLLSAASAGVLLFNVAITTATSNLGVVVACLVSSACVNGNSSGIASANITSPGITGSGGTTATLTDAGGFQAGALDTAGGTAMAWAVSFVISALANATSIAPTEFSGSVNLTAATVLFEAVAVAPIAAPSVAPAPPPPILSTGAIAGIAICFLGLLTFAARFILQRLAKALYGSKPNPDQDDAKGPDGGEVALREIVPQLSPPHQGIAIGGGGKNPVAAESNS